MYKGKVSITDANGKLVTFENHVFSKRLVLVQLPTARRSGVLASHSQVGERYNIMMTEFKKLPETLQKVGTVFNSTTPWSFVKRGNTFGLELQTEEMLKKVLKSKSKSGGKQNSNNKNSTVKPVPSQQKVTNYILCLDQSGSMGAIAQSSRNKAYKEFLASLAKQANEDPNMRVAVDVWIFGKFNGDTYNQYYRHASVSDIRVGFAQLDNMNMGAHGGTPLARCLIEAVSQAPLQDRNVNTAYFVYVLTDGQDTEGGVASASDLIKHKTAEGNWTFAFQVPNHLVSNARALFGLESGNIMGWETTTEGMDVASTYNSSALNAYASSRSMGITRSSSVYVDLSNLTSNEVKALDDITRDVRSWQVDKEVSIREFVEGKTGLPYVPGTAFYQLTKPEKIQPQKSIVIREKNTKKFYSGAEARRLIGLPDGQEARVKPGNVANYDVFVTSSSYNRKLVRGTTVLYVANAKPLPAPYVPQTISA